MKWEYQTFTYDEREYSEDVKMFFKLNNYRNYLGRLGWEIYKEDYLEGIILLIARRILNE